MICVPSIILTNQSREAENYLLKKQAKKIDFMFNKALLSLAAILLAAIPEISLAGTGDTSERIGVRSIYGIILVVVVAIVIWVKSKKSKKDPNKPL